MTAGPEGERLIDEREAGLNVVLRGIVEPVPMLAAIPAELVTFIELVAVALEPDVVEYAMLDSPVPPTREKRPE